ncbi:uncharacterized protein BCR38DRAFT_229337 [Pseudomassariella vexata]|uniref:RRM domain-containing protein n=1 Tax=Pseudomassariella vexata TaxID=1141098 RepID=A0A1Y2DWK9_9PEZI|nr:uncharacterized protein BCR38DRAFT_229337 [Pseudomassariella vexata]ORY63494.1 hypothetical protein BCR38DRAFT_229337 [Pseudomassariella vexata]
MAGKRRRDQAVDAEVSAPPDSSTQAKNTTKAEKPEQAVKEPASKRARVEASRSLFVRSLPQNATAESLTDFFSQHYPVKHATVVLDPATKTSRGYGFVTFTDPDDAIDATKKLQHHKLDGRTISLEVAEPRQRKPTATSAAAATKKVDRQAALAEAKKAPKLIIRNLPWSIKTKDQLGALFHSYGKVKYADLPQSKGKLSGFGFVTIRGRKNAEKALAELNGKIIDDRTLAVDWAVEKKDWEKQQGAQAEDKKVEAKSKSKSKSKSADAAADTNVEDDDEDKNKAEDEEEDEDLRNFMKNHMENLEDEDSDAEKEDEDEDEDDEDNGSTSNDKETKPPPKRLMTSNDTTIFIRNLPFSTTDAGLKSHFEQFGSIRYARVVIDRATDRPAGTGFVCFFNEEEFKACLKGAPRPRVSDTAGKRSILQDEMADAQGLYTLEGRVLQVSQAVNKDEASRLTATGVASRDDKAKDKRRLYLLAEGSISRDSPLHALLSTAEVQMRDDSAAQRKKLIQSNPSLHLSLTRLAIRNLPRNITSKDLKALAREAIVGFAKDVKEGKREPLSREEIIRGGIEEKEAERKRKEKGKGVVKQTKIVFENTEGTKVGEGDGAGKSRGYGFVEYYTHRAALMGLRWLNGHALKNHLGKTQRLIVEFAIENAQVVARRKDIEFKSNQGPRQPANEPKPTSFSAAARPNKKGAAAGGDAGKSGKSASAKQTEEKALEQTIIGRKRLMRKKKAGTRGGK